MSAKRIELPLYIHNETEQSYQFSQDGERKFWIKKFLVSVEFTQRNVVNVIMPEWFAYEKGLTGEEPKLKAVK